jgi:hypothetical protein
MNEVDDLVKRIIKGEAEVSTEDLQIYVNNSEEVERQLKEYQEEYQRRLDAL